MKRLNNIFHRMRKIAIMVMMVFACLQITHNNVAFGGLPVIDGANLAANIETAVTDTANSVSNVAKNLIQVGTIVYNTAQIALLVGVVATIVTAVVGASVEVATIITMENKAKMDTQTNANQGVLDSAGNESTLGPQLTNYNKPQSTVGTDASSPTGLDYNSNSGQGRPVTYYGNSANTLIGGKAQYSRAHAEQAQNFVANSSGSNIGIAKPNPTWRQHTTREAVQYNAYYNSASANQSLSTNALSLFSASGTTNSAAGNESVMSQVEGVFTYKKCDPNVPGQKEMRNIFVWLFCFISKTGAVIPAAGYWGFNVTKSLVATVGGLNATGASAFNFSVVNPLGKQADDAAAGATAKGIKKNSNI